MKKYIDWGEIFIQFCMLLIIISFIGASVFAVVSATTEKEIDSFTFTANITHMDKSTHYVNRSGTKTTYSIAVDNNDWFSYCFNINGSEYAKWKIGDKVKIKSVTYKNAFNIKRTEYKVIGVEK